MIVTTKSNGKRQDSSVLFEYFPYIHPSIHIRTASERKAIVLLHYDTSSAHLHLQNLKISLLGSVSMRMRKTSMTERFKSAVCTDLFMYYNIASFCFSLATIY